MKDKIYIDRFSSTFNKKTNQPSMAKDLEGKFVLCKEYIKLQKERDRYKELYEDYSGEVEELQHERKITSTKTEQELKKSFNQGFVAAVSCTYAYLGNSVEAIEALESCGLTTLKILKENDISEHDIKILKPVLKEMADKAKRKSK